MAKSIGVYILHNPNTEQVYIGSGVLDKREKDHYSQLRNGKHPNYKLQKAFNRDPGFQFIPAPIDDYPCNLQNTELAREIEQGLLDVFHGQEVCLNIAKDVDAGFTGRKHTEESIRKNREKAIERCSDSSYRERMGQAVRQAALNRDEEKRAQVSENIRQGQLRRYVNGERSPTFGQKRSEEFVEQCREKTLTLNQDPVYKQNHRNGMLGNDNAPRKEVVIEGQEFRSITEAANHFGMTKQGVIYRLESNSDKFRNWDYRKEKTL